MASEIGARRGNLILFPCEGDRLQKNNNLEMYCVRFATFLQGTPRLGNLPPGGKGVGQIKPSLLGYLRIFPWLVEEMGFFGRDGIKIAKLDLKI